MTDEFLKNFVRESNQIENIFDPEEDEQYIVAWNKFVEEVEGDDNKLSHGRICHLQKYITIHQRGLRPNERGYYRDMARVNVTVGGHLAPHYNMLPHLMENWVMDYGDPTKDFDPLKAHIRFEKNHPFVDGNGRTGRAIMLWHQLQKGQEPTMFKSSERHWKYYPLFTGKNPLANI